jgi:hypothetical protein
MVSAGCSFCRYFRHGGARQGFIDDGFAGGEGRKEGLDGEVIDGAGVAAAGLVDQGDRVVGEQGVGPSGISEREPSLSLKNTQSEKRSGIIKTLTSAKLSRELIFTQLNGRRSK